MGRSNAVPCMWKVECSNAGLDRSKLFQDAVTVPMSNAWQ